LCKFFSIYFRAAPKKDFGNKKAVLFCTAFIKPICRKFLPIEETNCSTHFQTLKQNVATRKQIVANEGSARKQIGAFF
jgi:hypothetical protein